MDIPINVDRLVGELHDSTVPGPLPLGSLSFGLPPFNPPRFSLPFGTPPFGLSSRHGRPLPQHGPELVHQEPGFFDRRGHRIEERETRSIQSHGDRFGYRNARQHLHPLRVQLEPVEDLEAQLVSPRPG